MNKSLLKSIGAVLAGFITVFILSTITDFILEAIGVLPSFDQQQTQGLYNNWLLLLALSYRTIYTILGGYITAKLAPNNKMRHVKILASIGLVISVLAVIGTWGKGLGPEWYPISLAILAYPSVWWGGKLKIKGGDS